MWDCGVIIRYCRTTDRRHLRIALLGIAIFAAGSYASIVVDGMVRRSEDTASAVARVKAAMPPGARLVSFCPTHHLFAYYYGEPIELRGLPDANRTVM